LDVFGHAESALTISVGDALRMRDDEAMEVILVLLALLLCRRTSLRRGLNPNCKKAELEVHLVPRKTRGVVVGQVRRFGMAAYERKRSERCM
jgi:hypothetical protein